jgi:hypothetical protein
MVLLKFFYGGPDLWIAMGTPARGRRERLLANRITVSTGAFSAGSVAPVADDAGGG